MTTREEVEVNAATIDTIHADLHRDGWSAGEIAYSLGHRLIWQVGARRGEKWIFAREHTQTAQWREAWREASATAPEGSSG